MKKAIIQDLNNFKLNKTKDIISMIRKGKDFKITIDRQFKNTQQTLKNLNKSNLYKDIKANLIKDIKEKISTHIESDNNLSRIYDLLTLTHEHYITLKKGKHELQNVNTFDFINKVMISIDKYKYPEEMKERWIKINIIYKSLKKFYMNNDRQLTDQYIKGIVHQLDWDTLNKYNDKLPKIDNENFQNLKKGVTSIIRNGIIANHQTQTIQSKEKARALISFYFGILKIVLNTEKEQINLLNKIQKISEAYIERDHVIIITQVLEIIKTDILGNEKIKDIETKVKAIKNITPLITTITAYTETYNKDEIIEKEKLRKKLIKNLMDETTNRTNRHGDWILTLGVNTGFQPIGISFYEDKKDLYYPQISLSLGLFMQRLPNKNSILGFHWGFFLFDLGQYVKANNEGEVVNPHWYEAFTAGIQTGIIIGEPDNFVTIGFDARWFPTSNISNTQETEFRIGVFAQYYVPIFDFN